MIIGRKVAAKAMSYVSVVAIAAVFGAAATAAQSVSNTTPNYTGYDVGTITGFFNNSLISSSDPALLVSGDLNGNFVNDGDMRSSSHGVVIQGSMNGDFTNSAGAEIFADTLAVFFGSEGMAGNFVNAGRIQSFESHGVYFSGELTGDFVNSASGEIRASDIGVYFSEGLDGNFSNAGDIYSGDSHGVFLCYGMSGDFTNAAGGMIWAEELGVSILNFSSPSYGPNQANGLALDGNFTNYGQIISGACHGVYISGGMIGDFVNATGADIRANDEGVRIENSNDSTNNKIALQGNFYNDGLIYSGDSHGVTVRGGGMLGNFTNAANGLIHASDLGVSIRRDGQDSPEGFEGNFLNEGEILSGDSHGVHIDGGFAGNFVNAAGASIRAKQNGVQVRGDDEDDADSFRGNFTNAGLIESGYSHGVIFDEGKMLGDFTNAYGGVIRAVELGVQFGDGLEGNFVNGGEIYSGDCHGVSFTKLMLGDFTNTATGTINVQDIAVLFNDRDTTQTLDGSFQNAGELIGGSHGVVFRGTFGGDFLNSASGRIASVEGTGVLLERDYYDNSANHAWNGSFTNAGLIEGSPSLQTNPQGYWTDLGTGVEVQGNFSGDFLNTGTIRAAQAVLVQGDFTGTYTNKGALEGSHTGYDTRAYFEDPNYTVDYVRYRGYSTVIGGNFDGDITNVIGEGIFVGTVTWDGVDEETAAMKAGTGTADLRGHTVGVHVNSIVTDGYSWTAVDAEDLLLDPGFSVNDNSYLFRFNHTTADNNLILTAEQTSTIANAIGGSAGDLGLAALLDGYVPGTSSQLDDILGDVHSQATQDDIERLLNEVSPAGRAMRNATLSTALSFGDVTNAHLRGSLSGPRTETAALGAGGAVVVPTADVLDTASTAVWLQAFGGSAEVGSSDTSGGVDSTALGAAIGVNYAMTRSLQLTGALGYYSSEADMTDQNDGDGSDANGWLIAGGMRYQPNQFYLLGSASVGFHSVDETRTDDFHGDVYSASYSGHHVNLGGEAGYEFSTGSIGLTPYIAATWHSASFEDYEESGGALALSVDEQAYNVALVDLGARASASMGLAEVTGLIGYRAIYGDDVEGDVTASLGGAEFETAADISMSGFLAGAGLTFVDLAGFDLGGSYRGIFGDDIVSHNVSVDLSRKF